MIKRLGLDSPVQEKPDYTGMTQVSIRNLIEEVTDVTLHPFSRRRTMLKTQAVFGHQGGSKEISQEVKKRVSRKASSMDDSFLDLNKVKLEDQEHRITVANITDFGVAEVQKYVRRLIGHCEIYREHDSRNQLVAEVTSTFYGDEKAAQNKASQLADSLQKDVLVVTAGNETLVHPPKHECCSKCGERLREVELGGEKVKTCSHYLSGELDHVCVSADNQKSATGEMSEQSIQPGGEDYEWAQAIQRGAEDLVEYGNSDEMSVEFQRIRPFDKYQGPYANMLINGESYQLFGGDDEFTWHLLGSIDFSGDIPEIAEQLHNHYAGDGDQNTVAKKTAMTKQADTTVFTLDGTVNDYYDYEGIDDAPEIDDRDAITGIFNQFGAIIDTSNVGIYGSPEGLVFSANFETEDAANQAKDAIIQHLDTVMINPAGSFSNDIEVYQDTVYSSLKRQQAMTKQSMYQINDKIKFLDDYGSYAIDGGDEWIESGSEYVVDDITTEGASDVLIINHAGSDVAVLVDEAPIEKVAMTKQAPGWVEDESTWEQAKDAVNRDDYDNEDSYYAVVTTVYKDMGGKVGKKAKNPEADKALSRGNEDTLDNKVLKKDAQKKTADLFDQSGGTIVVNMEPVEVYPEEEFYDYEMSSITDAKDDQAQFEQDINDFQDAFDNDTLPVQKVQFDAGFDWKTDGYSPIGDMTGDRTPSDAFYIVDQGSGETYIVRGDDVDKFGEFMAEGAPVEGQKKTAGDWIEPFNGEVGYGSAVSELFNDGTVDVYVREGAEGDIDSLISNYSGKILEDRDDGAGRLIRVKLTDEVTGGEFAEEVAQLLGAEKSAKKTSVVSDGDTIEFLAGTGFDGDTATVDYVDGDKVTVDLDDDRRWNLTLDIAEEGDVFKVVSKKKTAVTYMYGPEEAGKDDEATYHLTLSGEYLPSGNPPTDLNELFSPELLARVEESEIRENPYTYGGWDPWDWWWATSDAGRAEVLRQLEGTPLDFLAEGAEFLCKLEWWVMESVINRLAGGSADAGSEMIKDYLQPIAGGAAPQSGMRIQLYMRFKGTMALGAIFDLLDETAGWTWGDARDNFEWAGDWYAGDRGMYCDWDCCDMPLWGKKAELLLDKIRIAGVTPNPFDGAGKTRRAEDELDTHDIEDASTAEAEEAGTRMEQVAKKADFWEEEPQAGNNVDIGNVITFLDDLSDKINEETGNYPSWDGVTTATDDDMVATLYDVGYEPGEFDAAVDSKGIPSLIEESMEFLRDTNQLKGAQKKQAIEQGDDVQFLMDLPDPDNIYKVNKGDKAQVADVYDTDMAVVFYKDNYLATLVLEEEGTVWEKAAKKQAMITLTPGDFGTYLLVDETSGEDILIQTDYDYPGIAMTFGWNGDDSDIEGAQDFLDENMGATAEDPGYFG